MSFYDVIHLTCTRQLMGRHLNLLHRDITKNKVSP